VERTNSSCPLAKSDAYGDRNVKVVGIVLAYLVGTFFVIRAVVELVTIDYGDAASYEDDWGGPSLAGVLVVHCGLGVVSLALMIWGARRLRRPAR
jgi:hypothetical protein